MGLEPAGPHLGAGLVQSACTIAQGVCHLMLSASHHPSLVQYLLLLVKSLAWSKRLQLPRMASEPAGPLLGAGPMQSACALVPGLGHSRNCCLVYFQDITV